MFNLLWAVAATLGPIALLAGLIRGSGTGIWIGVGLVVIWVLLSLSTGFLFGRFDSVTAAGHRGSHRTSAGFGSTARARVLLFDQSNILASGLRRTDKQGPRGAIARCPTGLPDSSRTNMLSHVHARPLLPCTVAMFGLTSCADASMSPRQQVREVAHRYLVAVARGDGHSACALLSQRGLADGGYASRAACARAYSKDPLKKVFPILKITFRPHHTADVLIGDASASDSGNDTIRLRRYGGRCLIDAG